MIIEEDIVTLDDQEVEVIKVMLEIVVPENTNVI